MYRLRAIANAVLAAQVHVYGAGCPPALPAAAPYDQFFIPELRPAAEAEIPAEPIVAVADGEVAAQVPPSPPRRRPHCCRSDPPRALF